MNNKELDLEAINTKTLQKIYSIAKIMTIVAIVGSILTGIVLIIVACVIKLYYIIGIGFGAMIGVSILSLIGLFIIKIVLSYFYDIKMSRYYLESIMINAKQRTDNHETGEYVYEKLKYVFDGGQYKFYVHDQLISYGQVSEISNDTILFVDATSNKESYLKKVDGDLVAPNGVVYKKVASV